MEQRAFGHPATATALNAESGKLFRDFQVKIGLKLPAPFRAPPVDGSTACFNLAARNRSLMPVGVVGSLIESNLRIGAERSLHNHILFGIIVDIFCCNYLIWWNALLHPPHKSTQHIVLRCKRRDLHMSNAAESVRAWSPMQCVAPGAMKHL